MVAVSSSQNSKAVKQKIKQEYPASNNGGLDHSHQTENSKEPRQDVFRMLQA